MKTYLSAPSWLVVMGWLGVLSTIAVGTIDRAIAQVVPDASLGTESSVVTPNTVIRGVTSDRIDGGAIRGSNLFHSFQQFNIGAGRGAYFTNPAGVENILSRVTGNSRSEILGRLGVLGNANLFFLNPNGIVFGANASLDVAGSFTATTANAIQFENQGLFSATNPETPSSLLTINPSALVFNVQLTNPGQILVQGDGQGVRQNTNLIDTQNALRVPENRTLALVGGNLNLAGATLKTAGGRIELGSVAPGSSVKLIPISKGWALDYTGVQNFQDVQLTQQATVDASGVGGGDIQVQGRRIQLSGSSQIEASTLGTESGGILRLAASNSIELKDSLSPQYLTGLFSDVYPTASGVSGNILIETKNLTLLDGSLLSARNLGLGQGGNITVETDFLAFANGAGVISSTSGIGNAGNIAIETGFLTVSNGAGVSSSTSGIGNAGNISIFARNDILVENNSNVLSNVEAGGIGNAGNVSITANNLSLLNASQVQSSLREANNNAGLPAAQGKAGNIQISLTGGFSAKGLVRGNNNVFLSGVYTRANFGTTGKDNIPSQTGGNIAITAGSMTLEDDALIDAATFGQNRGGDIQIDVNQLMLRNGGQITSGSGRQNVPGENFGPGGNTIINARESIDIDAQSGVVNRSGIYSETSSRQNAGDLTVTTKRLAVRNGGNISSSAAGSGSLGGNSGNLMVTATESILLTGAETRRDGSRGRTSVITTEARGKGNSGRLTVRTGQLTIQDGTGILSLVTSGITDANGNLIEGTVGNANNIDITANSIKISDPGSRIESSTLGTGNAGSIFLRVADSVSVSEGYIASVVGETGVGDAGNLTIETGQLLVRNGAQVSSSTFGSGNASDLTIRASDLVEIDGGSTTDTGLFTQVGGRVGGPGNGNVGNLTIESKQVVLRNGGQVNATIFGRGSGGSLTVRASDIQLIGTTIVPGRTGIQPSAIQTRIEPGGRGEASNLIIEADRLSVRDGARVAADIERGGQGKAGSILIQAGDSVEVAGTSTAFSLPSLLTTSINQGAIGNAGNLTIESEQLFIRDGAQINARSQGQGNAGNIFLSIRDLLQANDGIISTTAAQSSGGAINITAKDIRLRGNSDITTFVNNGAGGGGNITLSAKSILAFNDSDILSFARDGQGGNITLNTRAFFGQNYRSAPPGTDPFTLNGNNRVDVNASGTVSGTITIPDTTFIQNSLTQLAQNLIDPNTLLANSCIVRSRDRTSNSTFLVTGSGGLPVRPGDPPPASFPTGEVRSLPQTQTNQAWKPGDPIAEPQGIYRLANGKLVMSRECAP